MTERKTRDIERELWIDADPDQVWQAFTEAEQIVNWFAPESASSPGVGGFIDYCWDPAHLEPSRCHVLEWEPGARLRMTWRDAPGGAHELPVELTLKGQDGGTLLRLVHSGFLTDASWDEEFESHGRGWSFELRSLKYYLENNLGRARNLVMERFPITGDVSESWYQVVGATGVFRVLGDIAEGMEILIDLPTGESSRAHLMMALEERDFVAIADVLQGGLFRLAVEFFTGVPEIWVWAHSWQLSEADLRVLMAPVYEAIRERLKVAETGR